MPEQIQVAIGRFLRREEDPWGKQDTPALGDKAGHKQLTSGPAPIQQEEEKGKYPDAPWKQSATSASKTSPH